MLTPPFWIRDSRSLIKRVAPLEDVTLVTAVPVLWCDVSDRTMSMLEVVPGNKAFDPMTRRGDVGERHARIRRCVF